MTELRSEAINLLENVPEEKIFEIVLLNFWAKVGKNALENPDLPVDFIAKIIVAKNQPSEKFEFEE